MINRKSSEIRIGTSGWHYDHWIGRFYPEKMRKENWLEFYAQHFDTVEINNTFYHMPREQTMIHWRDKVPANFLFAVKANRYITHIKKLHNTVEEVGRFFALADLLGDRLGPVLYQLPPSLHKNLERLDEFITSLPRRDLAVFEFRDKSWYDQETFDLMDKRGVALCVHDMGDRAPPRLVTGHVAYVRFHGTNGRYAGNYPDHMLHDWANWLRSQVPNVRAIYAYFNNDVSGHALNNARTLKQIMGVR
jgi:uncharacterized protein YecE (DUF72 family)